MRMFLLVLILAAACGASAQPTVFVSPSEATVEEGDIFHLSIRVDAGTDTLTCFLVEFAFDAAIVQLNAAQEGTLFAESGHETMFDWDTEAPGAHSCNDVTLGYSAYVLCPGELVELTFEALAWGETDIDIGLVDLRDIDRDPIPGVLSADGHVTVTPATGIGEDGAGPGGPLTLMPNPFRNRTEFAVTDLRDGTEVEFSVYDASGRLVDSHTVRTIAGAASVHWDGETGSGQTLPSGVYFVTAGAHGWLRRGRLVLLR